MPTGPCGLSCVACSVASGLQYGIMYMRRPSLAHCRTDTVLARSLQSGMCQNFKTMCRMLLAKQETLDSRSATRVEQA
jgi:hypothetical protein